MPTAFFMDSSAPLTPRSQASTLPAREARACLQGTAGASINDSSAITGVYADASNVFHGYLLHACRGDLRQPIANFSVFPKSGYRYDERGEKSHSDELRHGEFEPLEDRDHRHQCGRLCADQQLPRESGAGKEMHHQRYLCPGPDRCPNCKPHPHRQCRGQPAKRPPDRQGCSAGDSVSNLLDLRSTGSGDDERGQDS